MPISNNRLRLLLLTSTWSLSVPRSWQLPARPAHIQLSNLNNLPEQAREEDHRRVLDIWWWRWPWMNSWRQKLLGNCEFKPPDVCLLSVCLSRADSINSIPVDKKKALASLQGSRLCRGATADHWGGSQRVSTIKSSQSNQLNIQQKWSIYLWLFASQISTVFLIWTMTEKSLRIFSHHSFNLCVIGWCVYFKVFVWISMMSSS